MDAYWDGESGPYAGSTEENTPPLRINRVETLNQGILRDVDVSFGQLNELYGSPSSGKTTMLKTLSNVEFGIRDHWETYKNNPSICRRLNAGVSNCASDPATVSVTARTNLGDLVARHTDGRGWLEPEEVTWSRVRPKKYHHYQSSSWFLDLVPRDFNNTNRADFYRSPPAYPNEDPRTTGSNFCWGDIRSYHEALSELLGEVFQQQMQVQHEASSPSELKVLLPGEARPRYTSSLRFGLLRVAGTLSYLLGDKKTLKVFPNMIFLDHADAGLTAAEFYRYATILLGWFKAHKDTTQVFIAHSLNQPVLAESRCLRFDVEEHYTRITCEDQEVRASDARTLQDLWAWGREGEAPLPRAGWSRNRRVVKSNA